MRIQSSNLYLVLALLCSAVLALPALGQVPKAGSAQPSGQKQQQGLQSKMWWNQATKVQELGLSDEQRAQMDKSLALYMAGRREQQNQQQELLVAFGSALAKADLDAARTQRDEIGQAMADPTRRQLDMMIDVVSALNTKQREELVSRYPKLLSRLWIRSGNARGLAKGNPSGD